VIDHYDALAPLNAIDWHHPKGPEMISKQLFRVALISFALAGSGLALADGAASAPAKSKGGTRQNHHCKLADGTMDMSKTKKACLADKGTWAKDAAAAPAAAASK